MIAQIWSTNSSCPFFAEGQWLSADFPARLGVVAGTTTRDFGDLSPRTGDPQRARALAAGLGLTMLPWLQQVHGTVVLELPHPDPRIADAAWTRSPATACVVLTADCLPVLFAADDGTVVAAAHAGWRGLLAGVLENTVSAMGVPARELWVWLGPAISAASFEVGPEVREAFIAADPAAAGAFMAGVGDRWFADLYLLARQRLGPARHPAITAQRWCILHTAGIHPLVFLPPRSRCQRPYGQCDHACLTRQHTAAQQWRGVT